MENINRIKFIVEKQLNTHVNTISKLGNGATATAYLVDIIDKPYKIVVKTGNYTNLLFEEKKMLDFLSSKVDFKIPSTYFYIKESEISFLGMEFIEGICGNDKKIHRIKNKKHLANNIIDSFENMQSVHNDKFGFYENAVYNSWKEFYWAFFKSTQIFASEKYNNGNIKKVVIDALKLIEINFDDIFNDIGHTACISHGDFWVNNMIINTAICEVAGIFDPNNVAWVEPEYELFALTVGNGRPLKLYKTYKKRNATSKYCDLKIELYALVNELDWYKKLGFCPMDYLYYRSKRLIKQIKKNKLKRTV